MQSNYYLDISYYDNYSIYAFGLFDKKELIYYCGNNIIGEAFDDYKNIDYFLEENKNRLCININYEQFLKFKKINFNEQIKEKNLFKILNLLKLEEHVI